MKRTHVFVSGRVQGVMFRYFTKKKAHKLGLKGFVKNLDDGRVEIVVEGDKKYIRKFITWCKKGPIWSIVEHVNILAEQPKNEFDSFDVIR